MPRLSDMAKVTTRGQNAPDVKNELAYNAYCLYEAVKTEMLKTGCDTVSRNGVDGLEGTVSVPTAMKFLWPSLAGSWGSGESDEARVARVALYDYLRATKNLICVSPGNRRTMSTWWARHEWDDVPPEPKSPVAPSAAPTTVAPLSEKEAAGAPAAVFKPAAREEDPMSRASVINAHTTPSEPCRYCGRTFLSIAHLTRHVYRDHEDLTDLIINALAESDKPLTLTELCNVLTSKFSYIGGQETVRTRLTMMLQVADGILVDTKPREGFHAYSVKDNVTADQYHNTVSAAAQQVAGDDGTKCRDPECSGVFPDTNRRYQHEEQDHPYSKWRVWACAVCKEQGNLDARFYNLMGWSLHTSAKHNLSRHDLAFINLRREASRIADNTLEELRTAAEPTPELMATPVPAPVPVSEQVLDQSGIVAAASTKPLLPFDTTGFETALAQLHQSGRFFFSVAQEYLILQKENETLREQLAQRAASVPVTADPPASAGREAQLEAEISSLRQQLEALRKLMSKLA